ncbi:MAG: isoprenoid biosynthesis glyoxalase ElbB [Chlamydiae bacterium]|nr:isoprenoid biosynthesis glyoxalase ElbB [Chlamydiota bacterium]
MKAAVILSGCGVFDGSEIQEAVLMLLALAENGHSYQCYAPNIEMQAVSHISKKGMGQRNVLEESARIARGQIHDLHTLHPTKYDMLVLPGGMGVGKNLSTFVDRGVDFQMLPELKKVVNTFFDENKPIIAICMAPVILAKALQGKGSFKMTLGKQPENMKVLKEMGMVPVAAEADQMVQDGNLYTAAGYYEAHSIEKIYHSLQKIFHAIG